MNSHESDSAYFVTIDLGGDDWGEDDCGPDVVRAMRYMTEFAEPLEGEELPRTCTLAAVGPGQRCDVLLHFIRREIPKGGKGR